MKFIEFTSVYNSLESKRSQLKMYVSIVLLFFGFSMINAQNNHYYYYRGKKVPLTLDKQSVTVSVFSVENIRTVSPNFIGKNGEKIGMSDYFYVKLKKPSDFEKLKQLAKENHVRIIEQNRFMPLWYTLRCTKRTKRNTLEVANSFFETGLFSSSSPDFLTEDNLVFDSNTNQNFNQLRKVKTSSTKDLCANDRLFKFQWGLENPISSNIDIDACHAWEIAEGKDVNVAILDTGVELTHEDLADNISSLSYDTESDSSPSQIFYNSYSGNNHHGTVVAGLIGAIKDNNIGVAGIASQSTLISISNSMTSTPNSRMKRADGINWAWQNGADIINNSWFSSVQSDAIDDAINNALTKGREGKGTVVVFFSGNDGSGTVVYPANSNPNIISVGGSNIRGQRDGYSNYGDELDLVAPAGAMFSTILDNKYGIIGSGTSMATALVSGVAALILSVNPSLTAQEVRNILEQTAQKIGGYDYSIHKNRPNGPWDNEMGYGLVDAYAAVLMAQKHNSLDLYIKDFIDDLGVEPNRIKGKMWRSPGIWIRNRADGVEEHQNPVYKRNNNRNYVYVRIRNRSNIGSTGNDQVSLYWRKAGTVSRWPESWDGTTFQDGFLMGAPIGSIDIPALEPGEEVVLSIPWQMPNPRDYSNISPNTWHFCLLARIVSENDPMTNEQNRYTSTNARKNNNIAWKNVTVVKASSRKRKCKNWYHCLVKKGESQSDIRSFGGTISVGNPFDEAKTFSLELTKEESEIGKAIFEESEVSLEMDQTLYNAWERGGKQSDLLNNANDEKKKLVKGNHATLNNLRFDPNEMGTLNVSFNFLAKELTDKLKFVYHVIQKEAETGEIVGGETYVINKDLQVKTEGRYKEDRKLEINNKTISIDKPSLDKIIPNPASNTARITYNLGRAKFAYLTVTGFYHGATKTSNNYDLDINSRETTLDLTNYSGGHYQVALVCDGKIVEAKTLIKE